MLRACPEFIEGTGFRFPIGGWTHEQLKPKASLHLFDSLNRKPVVSYVEPSAIESLSRTAIRDLKSL